MSSDAARWRTARFALWAGISGVFAIALVVALVQGVHHSAPAACTTEHLSMLRALPWVLLGVIPFLVHLAIRSLANQAVQVPTTIGVGPYRAGAANTKTQFHTPRSHTIVRVLLLIAMMGIAVAQSRTWSCPFAIPASCRPKLEKIILVPIGLSANPSVVQSLVKHFRDCYSLPVSVGASIQAPADSYDARRDQWIAENLLGAIPGCKTDDPSCEHALYIAITDLDIYMSEYADQFHWIYTARNDERHIEIVSTARMGSYDEHPDRAFKIIARDIALDYCGLSISENSHSVLTPVLGGEADLDRIDESIW